MIRRIVLTLLAFALALSVLAVGNPSAAQTEEFSEYAESSQLAGVHADVFRLYWAFFDREPDLEGAQYWVGQYDACATLLDITWSFGNSPEFQDLYGDLNSEQFVELVYANVLDRAPDEEGRHYWAVLLETEELIQAEVMLYFSLSEEFKRRHALPSDGRPYRGCSEPVLPPVLPPGPTTTTSVTATTAITTATTIPATTTTTAPFYANCDAARAAGAAPVLREDPGYRSALDRDGDGVGCELE